MLNPRCYSFCSRIVIFQRNLSSKTPISKSVAASLQSAEVNPRDAEHIDISHPSFPLQTGSYQNQEMTVRKRRKKEILRMDESELKGYDLGVPLPSLLVRRGEAQVTYLKALFDPEEEKGSRADRISARTWDYEFTPTAVKRWYRAAIAQQDIKSQLYNPARNAVLGADLAASHFLVARHGRVRFRGHDEWIQTYFKGLKRGETLDDLPLKIKAEVTMPRFYDPEYRVEALDFANVPIHYEGLLNFENLHFVKHVSFENSPKIDDWCIDRIGRIFEESLEYLDLSGCPLISDRGLGSLFRLRNLKTLKIGNNNAVENLEMICALLEDINPKLEIIGIDYEKKLAEIKAENEVIYRTWEEKKKALESNTHDVESRSADENLVK